MLARITAAFALAPCRCRCRARHFAVTLALLLPMALAAHRASAQAVPLLKAHAHNDYHHPRPLWDALEQGFCSVEADIFLLDGQLLVGHEESELRPDRTLQRLYLDPLLARVERSGAIYRGSASLQLLIDIKSDGTETYRALHALLAHYARMLTVVRDGQRQDGAVTVVISGNRDWDLIAADRVRYAMIDGRLADLERKISSNLMPLISDRWGDHFQWQGRGPFPSEERQRLRDLVHRAHAGHYRLRFWATPDELLVWRELNAAGVDWINTDNLAGLAEFLRDQRGQPDGTEFQSISR